jgi:spoIIIJ-associated protein
VEWVEVTGRTVEEAKDAALDQLGVDESEAEFEVLEEPRAGLFGRLRAEARVRARVQPTAVRPKVERGSRRRGRKDRADETGPSADAGTETAEGAAPSAPPASPARAAARPAGGGGNPPASNGGSERSTAAPRASRPERRPKVAVERGDSMSEAGEAGGDPGELGEEFLRGLVSAFGVDGTVARHELDDGDTIELAVDGADVGMLIGPRGQTLSALQELTRTVVQRRAGDNQPRIVVDVGGYRKARREALERFTRDVAAQVLATGTERVLEPMPPADRKVVHDTANTIDGVSTSSEGEEPRRRVVITPAAG